jgi:AcrR family transcriptional regulator
LARRQAFLEAAREVFLEQGYEAASVNDVVRRAGGSLATLYAQFGNKEGLFRAVMIDQYQRFVSTLDTQCAEHLSLEEGLQVIGEHFLKAMLTRSNLAYFRIFVGEGRKLPATLLEQQSAGAEKLQTFVAEYLRTRSKVPDPHSAAAYLLELWRGRYHYRALTNENYVVTDAEIKEHVARTTKVLLRGVGEA